MLGAAGGCVGTKQVKQVKPMKHVERMEYREKIWLIEDLRALGKSDSQISYAVRVGKMHRVEQGVYTTEIPDGLLTLQALSKARPGLIYSGRTAAFLYGVGPLEWPAEGRVPRNLSRYGGELLRLRSYAQRLARQVQGVQVETPIQLAAELSGIGVPKRQIRRFLQQQYGGVMGNDRLAVELAGMRYGRADAEALLDGLPTGTASGLELRAVQAIMAALEGIPVTVTTNRRIRGYRFDVVIEEARVLVEIDSYAFHAGELGEKSAEEGFIRDRWKGNMATRWGWFLLRYSDDCVNHARDEMAQEVADTVRFLLANRWRRRRDEEALLTDQPVWRWHPLL